MRKLRILFYTLGQGFVGLKKNIFMILASVYVIFVALLVIGALGLASGNMQNELNKYIDKPEVRIDCSSDIADSDYLEMKRKIEAHPAVAETKYISKQENLNGFLALLGEDSDIFEDYANGVESFYISFEVKLKNSSQSEQFIQDMYNVDGVEFVKDNISVVNTFKRINNAVKIGTVVAVLVMGVLSVFLAVNTIKLTVINRKRAIEIMKYVGASNFYISGPFVIEGVAIGMVSSVISYFSLELVYEFIRSKGGLDSIFTLAPFGEVNGGMMVGFLAFGVAVGLISSLIAIRKYENV